MRSLLTKSFHITGEPAPRLVGVRICEGVCVCVRVYYCVCSSFECSLELRLRLRLHLRPAARQLARLQFRELCRASTNFNTPSSVERVGRCRVPCSRTSPSLPLLAGNIVRGARVCATVFVCVVVFPPLAAIYDTIHTRTDTHTHTDTLVYLHVYTCRVADVVTGPLTGWLPR